MPVVLGHDAVGQIVSTGQRVAIDPAISCRTCELCLAGRPSACSEYKFLGLTAPGTFASYLTLPKENLHVLPDSVSDEAGTVLEPITVGLHTVERLKQVVTTTAPLIVVGGGPIGIVAATVDVAQGLCFMALTTTKPSTAIKIIMIKSYILHLDWLYLY
jgi:L-iditol 2-dehydrogenase